MANIRFVMVRWKWYVVDDFAVVNIFVVVVTVADVVVSVVVVFFVVVVIILLLLMLLMRWKVKTMLMLSTVSWYVLELQVLLGSVDGIITLSMESSFMCFQRFLVFYSVKSVYLKKRLHFTSSSMLPATLVNMVIKDV